MTKESPLKMFQSSSTKKKSSATSAAKATATAAAEISAAAPAKPSIPTLDPTIEARLKRISEMRDEIDASIEAFHNQHGISVEAVVTYLSNSNNFSLNQWELLQSAEQAFIEQIHEAVDTKDPQIKEHLEHLKITTSTKKPRTSSKRKSKFVGSRRKWIPTS
jgi:hypothetical protein